ncbi:MAG: hypothetical protein WCW84_08010 [Sulfurimonas sp.]|jgi:hypothetical protein
MKRISFNVTNEMYAEICIVLGLDDVNTVSLKLRELLLEACGVEMSHKLLEEEAKEIDPLVVYFKSVLMPKYNVRMIDLAKVYEMSAQGVSKSLSGGYGRISKDIMACKDEEKLAKFAAKIKKESSK